MNVKQEPYAVKVSARICVQMTLIVSILIPTTTINFVSEVSAKTGACMVGLKLNESLIFVFSFLILNSELNPFCSVY